MSDMLINPWKLPPGLKTTHQASSWKCHREGAPHPPLYTDAGAATATLVFLGFLFHVQVSGPVLIWRVPSSVLSAGTDAVAVLLHGLPHLQLWGFPSRCSPDTQSNVPPHEGMLKKTTYNLRFKFKTLSEWNKKKQNKDCESLISARPDFGLKDADDELTGQWSDILT